MPFNLIPEDQYRERLTTLMEAIIPKGRSTNEETHELFRLYNDRLSPHETGVFCGSCVSRVYARMKDYYYSTYK